MHFHYEYTAIGGQTQELDSLCRQYGYDNPGPIAAYPPNTILFPGSRTPGVLKKGSRILVPWHQSQLKCLIDFSSRLAHKYRKAALEVVGNLSEMTRDIDSKLNTLDAICTVATGLVQLGGAAVKGAAAMKSGAKVMPEGKKWIPWLTSDRILPVGQAVASAVSAGASTNNGAGFIVRHTLGPWNPSYWASLWAAGSEGDMDIWLYGTSAIENKRSNEIKRQFDRDIGNLTDKVRKASEQMKMPFYNYRVIVP